MTEENYQDCSRSRDEDCLHNSSAVSYEEDLAFDKSEEGFFYELWRCLPKPARKAKQPPETWREGLNRARSLWDNATQEEQLAIRLAMNATDESHLAKNSLLACNLRPSGDGSGRTTNRRDSKTESRWFLLKAIVEDAGDRGHSQFRADTG